MGIVNLSEVTLGVDGAELVPNVTLDIAEGDHVAVLGPNGVGKSTFLRTIARQIAPIDGQVAVSGSVQMLDQFVARPEDIMSVEDLLLRYSPPPLRELRTRLSKLERRVASLDATESEQMAFAEAIIDWGERGGYDLELLWDIACSTALYLPFEVVRHRDASTLSGGEQKRLILEMLFDSDADVLLLDEPDNALDVPAKARLEELVNRSEKTIIMVSHDRALVEATARRIITLEGNGAWSYTGRFSEYDDARRARQERIVEDLRRWEEGRAKVAQEVANLRQWAARSDVMASRYKAAQTKYDRYLRTKPELDATPHNAITMRFPGSRSGDRVVIAEGLGIEGLIEPFDFEATFGDRVCAIGANGSGKSHFLRLLVGEPVAHVGTLRLGARVVPAYFSQVSTAPAGAEIHDVVTLVQHHAGTSLSDAMSALSRYGLKDRADVRYEALSGGQKARLRLLIMESDGANLLVLDEPTDNLDIESAEVLERMIAEFHGTVVAVSHDRWFINRFDRFLVFAGDGKVRESLVPEADLIVPSMRRAVAAQHERVRSHAAKPVDA